MVEPLDVKYLVWSYSGIDISSEISSKILRANKHVGTPRYFFFKCHHFASLEQPHVALLFLPGIVPYAIIISIYTHVGHVGKSGANMARQVSSSKE